ncbi:E3 ubiquitin-protein ligase [Entamoeba marina]
MDEFSAQSLWHDLMGKEYEVVFDECKDIIHTKQCRMNGFLSGPALVYHCKTCSDDPLTCICTNCFHEGDHKDHEYYAEILDDYYCSCGSTNNLNSKGFCPKHGKTMEQDIFSLIPKSYDGIVDKIEELIKRYILAIEEKKIRERKMLSVTIHNVMKIDLFYFVTANILCRPVHDASKSLLVQKVGYQQITYFQYLYEIRLTHSLNKHLLLNLISFQTNMDLITFPHSTIIDILMLTLSTSAINEHALTIAKPFISSLTYNIKHFFFNERINLFFNKAIDTMKIFLQDPTTNLKRSTNLRNFCEAMFPVDLMDESSQLQFAPEWFESFLNLLKICSNIDPVLIKTGDHAEITETLILEKLDIIDCVEEISRALISIIEVKQLHSLFPLFHSFVMKYVRSLLISVPQAKLNGHIVNLRIAGVNQPVSPISPLLEWYTKYIIKLKNEGIQISINSDDAFDLAQVVLISLRFKHQVELGKYVRNDDDPFHLFSTYIFASFQFILSDLTLLKLLVDYLDHSKLLSQWAVMFELFNVNLNVSTQNDIQELTLENLNLDDSQNFNSFISSIAEVERRFELTNNTYQNRLVEEFIINLTAAGVSSPSTILDEIPLDVVDFETIYDSICEKKGVLTTTAKMCIDPFFPFLIEHHEDLIHNTLLSTTTSPKQFSFPLTKPITSFRIIPFVFNIAHAFLTTQNTNYSTIPFLLVFLSDGGVKDLPVDDNILKDLGSIIGKHYNEVIGCEKIVSSIGGVFEETFIANQTTPIKKASKKKTNTKRDAVLKKFKKMQTKYVEDKKMEEDIVCDDDGCIVCQMKTTSPLGRMVTIVQNIALEGLAPLTINGCIHKIHESCYLKITDGQCPLCGSIFTNFLPNKDEVATMSAEKIVNYFLTLATEKSGVVTQLISSIDSTIHSIMASKWFNYVITESDNDIISTVFVILRRFASFYPSYMETAVLSDIIPEYAYILLRSYNLPTNDFLLKISINIAHAIQKVFNDQSKISLEDITNNAYRTTISQFNSFISIFEQCVSPGSTPPSISLDKKTTQKISDLNPMTLPNFQVFTPPDTVFELINHAMKIVCAICGNKPESYDCCHMCCKCNKLVCGNEICIVNHATTCSSTNLFVEFESGKVCLDVNGLIVCDDIFFNKYGDKFTYDHLHNGRYCLDKQRFIRFVQSYFRGSVLSSNVYEVIDIFDSSEE